MNSRAVVIIGLLSVIGLAVAPSGFAGHSDETERQTFIVGFHELPNDRQRYQGGDVLDTDEDLSFFVVETHNPDAFEKRVKDDDRAQYLEVDHTDWELFYTPNDERYSDMYGPQITNTESAWDTTLGSTSVLLGLLDTGITKSHEDFVESRISGWDYVNGDDSIEDASQCSYHGSHTAGTAAATTDNGVGVAGMSQSSIIMQKIFDKGGFGGCGAASTSQIAKALKDLGDQGAHISSNSWGGGGSSTAIDDAIAYAHDKGVVHVAAAGNDGRCEDCVSEPWKSNPDKVVIVACSTDVDKSCSFSSQGPEVDLAAPGEKILSVDGGGGYRTMSGTSMSTPHVAGAIGLYVAANGDASFSTIETALKDSADTIEVPDDRQGGGRLNTGAFVASGDGGGDGGEDTNSPPTAEFTYSCTDLTCDLDASGSSDSDGSISSYDWDLGDGNTATGATVSHTYESDGTYTVTLTVTDDDGATDSSSQDVSVSDGTNSAPTAEFTSSCTDLTCDLDASGSSDSDGTIASYDWDLGDGTTATGQTVTHTYDSSGDYTVTLTVTDDDGATDTSSQILSVSDSSSDGDSMHVHAIDQYTKGPHLWIDVTIYDSSEGPVSDATVGVEVCDSSNTCQTGTGTTGSDGLVQFRWHKAGSGTYTTCVTELTHSSLTWDTTADHAGDGNCETQTV